mgnify:CR=1 FL=1
MIYTVEDRDGLYDALAKATGGDTIRLQAGDYGSLNLGEATEYEANYDSPVTIVSANPSSPASFSGLNLGKVSNLTFDDIAFDYEFQAGDPGWIQPFVISESSNVTILNSVFDGDVASGTGTVSDGYGTGGGLIVSNSTGFVLDGNEFHTWGLALSVRESSDIQVTRNDVHGIRSDGFNFAAVESVLIEDNYLHDFIAAEGSGDHLDMIQFFTTGTDTPSTDIIIRGNNLDIGDGDWTQSIFMRNGVVDQGAAGSEMFYQNVLIEENVILNGHLHGITVGETDGLTIRNNTVLSIDASDERLYVAPTILVADASKAVTIENNAVAEINGYTNQADWSLSNNAYVQNTDPNAPGFYFDQFLDSSMYDQDGVQGYVVGLDSMIARLSAGATRLYLDTTPDNISPQFDVTSSADVSQTLVFDATHTYGPSGQILAADAEFIWDFGDGTTATGRVVEHNYDAAGRYGVTLRVLLDGQEIATAASAQAEVGVAGSDVLVFNANNGRFFSQGYGQTTAIDGSGKASVETLDGKSVDLGGTGVQLEIPQDAVARLAGADSFKLSMTLQADQPNASWGEVARISSGVVVSVQGSGNLNVHMIMTSGEQVSLTTQGVSVNDGSEHDISIRLDGASDSLQVLIDGVVVGATTVTSAMSDAINSPLVFGNPWGGQNFDGKLSAFDLDVIAPDYSVYGETISGGGTSTPAPEDETSLPVLDDYVVDFAALTKKELKGDAVVVSSDEGSAVQLDGERDVVNLGKLEQFETARQLSISSEFRKANADDAGMKLVWNNKNVGLVVEDDGLRVYVAEKGTAFGATDILIDDLGLDDTDSHQATVIIDSDTDRLQVILDGAVVYEEQQERNIELTGLGDDKEYNWLIGTQKNEFAGEVYEFMVDADADFVATGGDDFGVV